MKPQPLSQDAANPNVFHGDVIYYNHPENGAMSGRVASIGKHGVQVEHEEGLSQVRWEQMLGHKERAERKLTLVERGEDGGIATDDEGKRVFVAGEIPEEEAEPLAKSITAPSVRPPTLKEQAVIDVALINAGFEPSLEYIQKTYGNHWTKREVVSSVAPVAPFDSSEIVHAIAEVKAHGEAAVNSVRSEIAMHISALSIAIDKTSSPVVNVTLPEQKRVPMKAVRASDGSMLLTPVEDENA